MAENLIQTQAAPESDAEKIPDKACEVKSATVKKAIKTKSEAAAENSMENK